MTNNLTTRKILTYAELAAVDAGDDQESLVDVRAYDPTIISQYAKWDMADYTGDAIYVRDSLARKLADVNRRLADNDYSLKVQYGYRHPEVQQRYFTKQRARLQSEHPDYSDDELDTRTHNFVAVPSVAGHPAGAAVDVTIIGTDGQEIDMGTPIADYSDPEKILTDSRQLTPHQIENRALLHDLMVEQGFAPFYGEWWHFSYGDREWAAFYGAQALYGPIDYNI